MDEKIKRIVINKNRGWRGLAELRCENECGKLISKMIFSFSQPIWEDMLGGSIVAQDKDNYYIIRFNNTDKLPKPTQQRSVLIKNFYADVELVTAYSKSNWRSNVSMFEWNLIDHFIRNRNNHTQSDWNCIGIRVIPTI